MAQDLNLNVLLRAIDKATGPLRDIKEGSGKTAKALKASRDQLRELENAQKNLRGFAKLKRSSENTATALDEQQRRVRELTQEIDNAEGSTKRLNQQRNNAIKAARKLKQQYKGEQEQLQELRGKIKNVDELTGTYSENQRELARRVDNATRQIREQEDALKRTARRQRAAADAARQYARSQSRATGMVTTGAGGVASGAAALYAGGRLLAPGIDYGEQISELQAVLRLQKDSTQMLQLAAQARELGASTQYSASQAAAGQTFLARAGFTPAAIQSSMRDVLDLALSGRMDLGRAADISSNIASAFKIDPEVAGNIKRVGDVLTATSTRANVDLEMLGETMKYLGQAEGLDVSLEQAAAMAGLLGNIGIQGSMAGTTLRAMLTSLSAPTAEAQKAMDALNLSVADSQGNLRAVPDIIADIAKATEDMGNAQRAAYVSDIFGQRAGSGVSELIAQVGTGGIKALTDALKNAAGENAATAKTMADNVGGDLKSLQSAWQEVGISITEVNKGAMRDLIGNITDIMRGVGDWIKDNPQLAATIAKIAAGVAALVTVGGTLTLFLGSILGPIALLRYALLSLNVAAALNPVTLAIAAIATAGALIYKNWDQIAQFFKDRWADIKAAFSGGIGEVAKLLLNWNPIALLYRGITAGLEALGVDLPDQFKTLGGAIVDGLIGGLTAKLSQLKDTVTGLGSSAVGWFKNTLGINSPSRVFADFGRNTVDGYRLGLAARESRAVAQMGRFADNLTRAGAGVALAAGMGGAAAAPDTPIQFDTRPPVAASTGGSGLTTGDIKISISAAPGMDEAALSRHVAAEVQRALAEHHNRAGAARRSALYDTD